MSDFRYRVVDPSLEVSDPNPNIHQLFVEFNDLFFWGKLATVYVQWSPRMTLCAGLCRYHPRNRECSIHLSQPLMAYRSRKDLVETLLHEMIHAYLFMADGDRERESHGPKFHEHMYRINKMTGTNITVYHSFHDEVNHYKTHWWKCDGPCQHRHPFYGIVKRSMNRAPGPNDFWYKDHQNSCGGKFIKIKEPEPKKTAKRKKDESTTSKGKGSGKENNKKINDYFASLGSTSPATSSKGTRAIPSATATSSSATATATASIPFNLVDVDDDIEIIEVKEVSNTTGSGSGSGHRLGGSAAISNKSSSSSSTGASVGKVGSSSSSISKPTSKPTPATFSSSKSGQPASQKPPNRRGDHPLLAKWLANYKH